MASAHTPSRHATAPFFPAAPAARWRPVAAVAAVTAAATTAVELAAGRGIGGGNGGTSPGATKQRTRSAQLACRYRGRGAPMVQP